jgi:hypothetical protein
MSMKISHNLEEAKKKAAHQEIPVIVKITPGTDLTSLEQRGLKIQRTFENDPTHVAGTLSADGIDEIAQLDEVEEIEHDERGVHTLEGRDRP